MRPAAAGARLVVRSRGQWCLDQPAASGAAGLDAAVTLRVPSARMGRWPACGVSASVVVRGRGGRDRAAHSGPSAGTARGVGWSWIVPRRRRPCRGRGGRAVRRPAALPPAGPPERVARASAAGDLAVRAGEWPAPGSSASWPARSTPRPRTSPGPSARRRDGGRDRARAAHPAGRAAGRARGAVRRAAKRPSPVRLASLHDQARRLGRVADDLGSCRQRSRPRCRCARKKLTWRTWHARCSRRASPKLRAAGLDIRADLAEPVAACADPGRIHQVIEPARQRRPLLSAGWRGDRAGSHGRTKRGDRGGRHRSRHR